MGLHWTYKEILDTDNDLRQGDFLYPTENLKRIIGKIHPHFCDSKYVGFLVVTQCCDLVRRTNRKCKAEYISIAVVRNLEALLEKFFDKVCKRVSTGIYLKESKPEAHNLIERILNQNEQALGLFYLHPSESICITEKSVVLLRVTLSLRSDEHYETLLEARRGSLSPEFRNKVGWLTGNLYSRIGTRDWVDKGNGEKSFNLLVKELINSDEYEWVEESLVETAKKENVNLEKLTPEEVINILEEYRPPSLPERIAPLASSELTRLLDEIPRTIAGISARTIKGELPLDDKLQLEIKLREAIERELILAFETIPNEIATKVTELIIANEVLDGIQLNNLEKLLQSILMTSIENQIQELPRKLKGRLMNNPCFRDELGQEGIR